MSDSSTQGIKTVLHPVSDLARAKAVYTALLGVPPQNDESYYVGFEAAGQHIGLVPGGGRQGMTGAVAYWWPRSPTPTAMSSGCCRTRERRRRRRTRLAPRSDPRARRAREQPQG